MATRREKRIRKLKKSHTWIWLIIFTLLIILSCVLVAFFISVYTSSFINGKLDAGRNTVKNMADIYERCSSGGDDPSAVLAAFGLEYIVLDSERNIVYPDSPGTCILPDGQKNRIDVTAFFPVEVSAFIYDANVYPDTEAPFIIESADEGEIQIYIIEFLKDLDRFIVPSDRNIDLYENDGDDDGYDSIGFLRNNQDKMLRIPLWIGIRSEDGSTEFIAKSYITAEMTDLVLLFILMTSIWLLVFFIYLVMIINIITGITRRRKTLRVFFSDAVTQGNNYMYFVYKGEEMLKKRRNHNDRFYVVNLSFVGYRNYCVCHSAQEGENAISLIYNSIKTEVNRKNEICARTAEANFAILLSGGEEEEIRARVQSIIDKASHVTEDHVFVFQAGIEIIEPVSKAGDRKNLDLSEKYNIACAARESLGNEDMGIAFFSEKLVEDRRWAETVQDRQQSALDNEEFVVYYQPKYDPRTDELRGAEALIRWQSPEFGFVPPGRMIPIFEKNGFITEIDHYMIKHVARDQKRWYDSGLRCVPVSVNVSRAHFIESDLAEQIRDTVDAEGTPHELIEIELTESAFFDDKKAMISTIERLKSYGFAVSMDDFGSGYSSLNSLKDMPLDVLKLDAEFFRGENGGERGEIVVSEAIKLAKSLNMRTVAEGVEVREQVDFLADHGCDMIQGYFYAKPMPGADYEVRMNERYKPKNE